MDKEWSFIRKLIWLKATALAGESFTWKTVTGTAPLTLANAVEQPIQSVVRYGRCAQATTPSESSPVPITCNNGDIKFSLNKCDMKSSNIDLGHYISSSGQYSSSGMNFLYIPYIAVKPSTKYTLSMSSAVYYITISEFSANDGTGFIVRNAGATGGNTSLTITTDATTQYVRFGANLDSTSTVTEQMVLEINWMFVEGETALPYAPYVSDNGGIYIDGTPETVTIGTQTATVENLLCPYKNSKSYADEQDLITGEIKRNANITVFDGTERWALTNSSREQYISTYSAIMPTSGDSQFLCTHGVWKSNYNTGDRATQDGKWTGVQGRPRVYPPSLTGIYASADAFKAWLAEQYAAGTPLMIVHKAKTASTEAVEGQALSTAAGSNTITSTSNVSTCDLTVTYAATD